MLFPIRTDYRMTRRPLVNYLLIAANVLLFLVTRQGGVGGVRSWLLQPYDPRLYQFFTSMFLHADLLHLLGNMVFLWVFGNAINDRLGHLGYLLFYLAGGVLAAVGYLVLTGHAPMLGASGAIAAVTGAFLVLLPRTRVTVVLLFFFFFPIFEVSSLVFLAFQFAFNFYSSLHQLAAPGAGGVAYAAHTSGYVFGIAVSAGLLALRLLPRDPLDLLNLFRAWRRRRAYRRTVAGGYDPFSRTASAVGPGAGHGATRRVAMQSVGSATPQTPQAQAMRVRRRIAEAIRNHDLSAAADHYVSLVGLDDQAVLAQPRQLDVANQLMAEQRHADAADAYERFLRHYAAYEHTGDIFLMLGLLYGRYLQQYPRAEECLSQAAETLRDRRKADMARRELQIVRRRLES